MRILKSCKFYIIEESFFDDLKDLGTFEDTAQEIMGITETKGELVETYLFNQLSDFFNSVKEMDAAIFNRNFTGVLLTCFSPLKILDKYASKDITLGYISNEIINDTESYYSNSGYQSDLASLLTKVIVQAKESKKCIISIFE